MSDFEDRLRGELQNLASGVEPPPTLVQNIDGRLREDAPRTGPWGRPLPLIAVAAAILLTAVAVIVTATRHNGGKSVLLTQGTSTTAPSTTGLGGVVPGLPGPGTSVNDTTTAFPGTTTATVNLTTTTTSSTAAVRVCATSDLKAITTTDQSRYTIGQTVTFTVKVMNTSTHSCQIENPTASGVFAPLVSVYHGSTPIYQPAPWAAGIGPQNVPKVLTAGQSYVWTTEQWNQEGCVAPCTAHSPNFGTQVPIGTYQGVPQSPPGTPVSATFTIGL